MKTILFIGFFEGLDDSHGGEKRTAQLKELALSTNANISWLPVRFIKNVKYLEALIYSVYYFKDLCKISSAVKVFSKPKQYLYVAYVYRQMIKLFYKNKSRINQSSLIVFENTFVDFLPLLYILKKNTSKQIVAAIHNIEALVPLQYNISFAEKFSYVKQEVELLGLCNSVFTISQEEQWLLRLFNINSYFLPYFPTQNLYQKLLNIRIYREAHGFVPKNFFLVIASVSNPPTRKGVEALLQWFIQSNLTKEYSLVVGGYGSQSLQTTYNHASVQFIGEVSEEVILGYMQNCKGCIVNQGYSTGALTKNIEHLVAGITVFADEGAARSYRNVNGLLQYSNFIELEELLQQHHHIPNLPKANALANQAFINALLSS